MKLEILFKLFFLFAVFASSSAVDYCSICTNHVACNNPGNWGPNCVDPELLTLSADIKASILHSHNSYRQKVASGGAAGFTSATKMSRIVWDEELAYVAEFNVKKCQFKYDQCLSTDSFPLASQNINLNFPSGDLNSTLIGYIDQWYNKFSLVSQANVDSAPLSSNTFLTMMQEKVTAIGCAVVRYTYEPGFKAIVMTCNYGFKTYYEEAVYTKGIAASECSQIDATYSSLCAIPPPGVTTPATFDSTTIKPAAEYCSLCVNHTVCVNSGNWYSICPDDKKIVPISNSVKESILKAHNYYRNKVAGGGEPGFNSAVKMNKLVWDDELAYVASFNVRQCEMKHDLCWNTSVFSAPGQNLAIHGISPAFDFLDKTIAKGIFGWYDEIKLANQGDIDVCCGGDTRFHKIGHFLALMQDRSTHVGCSVARYTQADGYRTTLLACNYAMTNLQGEKVYVSGEAGSQCLARDPVFTNLCVDSATTTTEASTTVTTSTTIIDSPTTSTILTDPPTTTSTLIDPPTTTSTISDPPTTSTTISNPPTTTESQIMTTSATEPEACCDEMLNFIRNLRSNTQNFNTFFQKLTW